MEKIVPVTGWIRNEGKVPELPDGTVVECLFVGVSDYTMRFVIGSPEPIHWYNAVVYRVLADRTGWVIPTLEAKMQMRGGASVTINSLFKKGNETLVLGTCDRDCIYLWSAKTGKLYTGSHRYDNYIDNDLVPLQEPKEIEVDDCVYVSKEGKLYQSGLLPKDCVAARIHIKRTVKVGEGLGNDD